MMKLYIPGMYKNLELSAVAMKIIVALSLANAGSSTSHRRIMADV